MEETNLFIFQNKAFGKYILFKRGQICHVSTLGILGQQMHILNNSNFICKTSFILLVHNVLYKLNKWLWYIFMNIG